MAENTADSHIDYDPFESGNEGSWLTRYLSTALVVVNGLVLSLVACVILNIVTTDMQRLEVDHSVKGVFASIQQNMNRFEASIGALAASLEDDDFVLSTESLTYLKTTSASVRGFKTLVVAQPTNDGWFEAETIAGDQMPVFSVTKMFPRAPALIEAFESLEKADRDPTHFHVVSNMDALVPSGNKNLLRHIGFMKPVNQNGARKVLLIIAETRAIFGANWQVGSQNLTRTVIQEPDSEEVVYQAVLPGANKLLPFTQISRHKFRISIGDRDWLLFLDLAPSRGTTMLGYLPYLMLLIGAAVTCVFGIYMYTRQRQTIKMARISETLEGTSTELKKKITERDKLFHQLRRSERENRALINSISDTIFETDKDGVLVFLSKSWENVTGFQTDDALGQSLFELIDQVDQEAERRKFREMVSGERQAYRSETRIKAANDSTKAIEMAISMLRVADDGTVRVVGTITDIEQRLRAEMALREAEKKYRAIVENVANGIYQSTPDGRFLSANQALADILGYDSPHDLIESVTNIGKQVYVDPKQRVAFASRIDEENRVKDLETQVYKKDGSIIWISENARAVRENGKIQYYEGMIEDVTQRREAEQALKDAKLQSDITSRAKSEFLANMSHELRTPLNAIIGFAEILKDEVFGDIGKPEYKDYANDVYESGCYLLKIINEILEVSKIEVGNRELNESPFPLSKVIQDCLTLIQPKADQAGISIINEIPKDLPHIFGEELAFKQIMANLLGNAVKYTEKGGHVTVRAEMGSVGRMHIEVIDDGIGIAQDQIDKVMLPFGQADTDLNRDNSGTGLGLTIVDSLVKLHDGTFQLISEIGQGTTARIILPSTRVMDGKEPGKSQSA